MRFLLAGIFTLLPFVSQTDSLAGMGADSSESLPDRSDTATASVPTEELGPSRNPYDPASPTNFEVLVGPYLYVQGRSGAILYDPRLPNSFDLSHRVIDNSITVRHEVDRFSTQSFLESTGISRLTDKER